jgi:hypothetical protein
MSFRADSWTRCGALVISAGFIAVGQFWRNIPTGAQLAFAATAAVILAVVGAVMPTGGDPAFGRLRTVLWTMSTASLTALMGLLAAQVWHLGGSQHRSAGCGRDHRGRHGVVVVHTGAAPAPCPVRRRGGDGWHRHRLPRS